MQHIISCWPIELALPDQLTASLSQHCRKNSRAACLICLCTLSLYKAPHTCAPGKFKSISAYTKQHIHVFSWDPWLFNDLSYFFWNLPTFSVFFRIFSGFDWTAWSSLVFVFSWEGGTSGEIKENMKNQNTSGKFNNKNMNSSRNKQEHQKHKK